MAGLSAGLACVWQFSSWVANTPSAGLRAGLACMFGGTGEPKGRSAAGAVAAAVRELRPLEVVGVYEARLEGLEVPPLALAFRSCKTSQQCATPHPAQRQSKGEAHVICPGHRWSLR